MARSLALEDFRLRPAAAARERDRPLVEEGHSGDRRLCLRPAAVVDDWTSAARRLFLKLSQLITHYS